jgi:hypothetical protein
MTTMNISREEFTACLIAIIVLSVVLLAQLI